MTSRSIWLGLVWCISSSAFAAEQPHVRLEPANVPVPFCYLANGARSWQVLTGPLADGDRVELELLRGDESLSRGEALAEAGLTIRVLKNGRLEVIAEPDAAAESLRLRLKLVVAGRPDTEQLLTLRPAPPRRPIGYLADLIDDLIHTYYDAGGKRFRPINRGAFDQYFRRLQAHGVHRLIVWHSPFPYFTRPEDHAPEHWANFVGQANAISACAELKAGFRSNPALPNWQWMVFLMELRQNPEAGPMFARSAAEHGIALAASFEPFESALTKYYEVPTFAADGQFLWGFLPLAMPAVNDRPDELCFGHYREILRRMNQPDMGRLGAMELPGLESAATLVEQFGPTGGFVIHAAKFPPIAANSFVLSRQTTGEFRLIRYADISATTEAQRQVLTGFRLETTDDGTPRLTGLEIPFETRYLLVSHPQAGKLSLTLDREFPVQLWSRAGNRLNRETIWWMAHDETAPGGADCRIAGITPDGEFRTPFQANQNSISRWLKHDGRVPLAENTVVVDLGDVWSVELLDFEQPAARQMAVSQLRTLLNLQSAGDPVTSDISPRRVYDEIFINTRSHVDLATTMADGVNGQLPIAHYYRTGRQYLHHLGLDRAYAPRSVADMPRIRAAAESATEAERLTTWQDAEWRNPCQSPDSPLVWRYSRNAAVSRGMTQLLQDLEREFPDTRIRAVIPPREAAIHRIQAALERMPDPAGNLYGRDFYQKLWCSNNHVPHVGEGMAMVDLSGMRIEPVFLGSGGYLVEDSPFRMFVDEQILDLADQRHSNFRGPKSYFFEAQFTLRAADRADARRQRERMICELLSRRDDIGEVLLYEATDWLHSLPLDDPDYSSHAFTERCGP